MKQFIKGPLPGTARNLMRRLGYGEIIGKGQQLSYAMRISRDHYPRYHAYIEDRDGGMQVNLHIDQKKASYKGSTAHSGEYEGPLVEKEMERIVHSIAAWSGSTYDQPHVTNQAEPTSSPQPPAPQPTQDTPKKSKFWD